MTKKTIIEGITEDGKKFRPSDWAERVSGNLLTIKNHRLFYSPLLQPKISSKGSKCLVLDEKLKETNPALYEHIMTFVKSNKLRICSDEENDENDKQ